MLAIEHDGLTVLEAPSAYMTYVMSPYRKLVSQFLEYLNPEYDGIMFTAIAERANTIRTPRTLPFKNVRRNQRMSDPEMVAKMLRRGLLPALPEEELDFLSAHPGELKSGTGICALGAHIQDRSILVAWGDNGGRQLGLLRADSDGDGDDLFLAIPIEALKRAA